jgi:hypothetical protein
VRHRAKGEIDFAQYGKHWLSAVAYGDGPILELRNVHIASLQDCEWQSHTQHR